MYSGHNYISNFVPGLQMEHNYFVNSASGLGDVVNDIEGNMRNNFAHLLIGLVVKLFSYGGHLVN